MFTTGNFSRYNYLYDLYDLLDKYFFNFDEIKLIEIEKIVNLLFNNYLQEDFSNDSERLLLISKTLKLITRKDYEYEILQDIREDIVRTIAILENAEIELTHEWQDEIAIYEYSDITYNPFD